MRNTLTTCGLTRLATMLSIVLYTSVVSGEKDNEIDPWKQSKDNEEKVLLEEAKQVTAAFETQAFVPPPRTIDDLKKRVGTLPDLPDSAACVKKQQSRAKKLAVATARVGKASTKTARDDAAAALVLIANSEFLRGNFRATTQLILKAINALPARNHKVRQATFYAHLASVFGSIGDASRALSYARKASGLWAYIKTRDPSRYYYTVDGTKKRLLYGALAMAGVSQALRDLKTAETQYRYVAEFGKSVMTRYTFFDYNRALVELSSNLLQQGRLAEAEQIARDAVLKRLAVNYKTDRFNIRTATAFTQLAAVLNEQGRLEDAEYVVRIAFHLHEFDCAEPQSLGFVRTRQILAAILAAKQDWAGVIVQIESALSALSADPQMFHRLFGENVDWALALIHEGRTKEGLDIIEQAMNIAIERDGKDSYGVAEVRGLMGMALAANGDTIGSLQAFQEALPLLIQGNDQLAATTGQASHNARARRIIESYMHLLLEITDDQVEHQAGINAATELFEVASVLQTGSVQRALAAAAVRSHPDDADLADLLRREQNAAQEMNAALNTLASLDFAPHDQVDQSVRHELRERVTTLRAARVILVAEIRARFPEFTQLMTPNATTIEELQDDLLAGEALVTTFVTKDKTLIWAIPNSGPFAFAVSEFGRQDIDERVATLRAALAPNARTLGDIPEYDLDTASDLFEALLEPVKSGWHSAQTLIVVGHESLGYLPFSLLPTQRVPMTLESEPLFAGYKKVPWLIRNHAVVNLPSVSSLKTLRGLSPGNPDRANFVGFGDPLFSTQQAAVMESGATTENVTSRSVIQARGLNVSLREAPGTETLTSAGLAQLTPLPETAEELRSIAMALNADLTQEVFLRERASEKTVKALNLSSYRILAFATHGLVPGDLDGLLQPALALSSPAVTGHPDEDGLLTMSEILAQKLDADWVVLSACNTGSGEGVGAEAVSGLGRSFFYAGARSLLVSNWPVETSSAKTLTTSIFQNQSDNPDLSRAKSLQKSMVNMIDGPGYQDADGATVFSYAHPIFWGPFSLIGDGA